MRIMCTATKNRNHTRGYIRVKKIGDLYLIPWGDHPVYPSSEFDGGNGNLKFPESEREFGFCFWIDKEVLLSLESA